MPINEISVHNAEPISNQFDMSKNNKKEIKKQMI